MLGSLWRDLKALRGHRGDSLLSISNQYRHKNLIFMHPSKGIATLISILTRKGKNMQKKL